VKPDHRIVVVHRSFLMFFADDFDSPSNRRLLCANTSKGNDKSASQQQEVTPGDQNKTPIITFTWSAVPGAMTLAVRKWRNSPEISRSERGRKMKFIISLRFAVNTAG